MLIGYCVHIELERLAKIASAPGSSTLSQRKTFFRKEQILSDVPDIFKG